ncbi:YCF48-related protein [Desulfuromonas sp. TF]|uniref:YCF48-related protein n=1 Tax=Desulfuromonas sp. TF TaxID=1232410 RepID=UPI0004271B33|nr:YCF48-related protein [Desulfuromonas sp. TF]
MTFRNQLESHPRKIKTVLLLLAFPLLLMGCEAKLDLDGVHQERTKSVRRTDNFQAVATNEAVVTVVGDTGVIITSPKPNGIKEPLQWTRTGLMGKPNLIDIDSCPDNSLIALSVEQQVWISIDNGQDWTKSDLPTREDMLSLTCAPNGDYWVVGSFTTLLHSTNQGKSWKENSLDQDAMLTKIKFLDAQNGFVLGEFGLTAKTEDGGQSWQRFGMLPADFYPQDSYFADLQHGWAAGLYGTILHTTDGGATWRRQETPTDFPLYGFHAEGGRLFVFGEHGTVLELSDQRWVALDTSHLHANGYLRDGEVLADDLLLVAGGRGTIITTNTKQEQ